MAYDFWIGLAVGAICFSFLFIVLMWFLIKRTANKLFNNWLQERLKKEVAKSLEIQRPVIKGKISEQLFPLLYNKLGDLADFRFLGAPVDYIIFQGLSASDSSKIDIKFVEVKTGEAKMNKAEERVKDAIINKRVGWEEIKL